MANFPCVDELMHRSLRDRKGVGHEDAFEWQRAPLGDGRWGSARRSLEGLHLFHPRSRFDVSVRASGARTGLLYAPF